MKAYKEFTYGWIVIIFLVATQLVLIYLFLTQAGDRPLGTMGFLLFTALFILVFLLFYGMNTSVTAELITVSFGIGLIKKKISVKRIKSVETVKTPWYYGWGIRLIPKGVLYNMSGTSGVELKFHDTTQVIRIGTKNPGLLKKEIELRVGTRPTDR